MNPSANANASPLAVPASGLLDEDLFAALVELRRDLHQHPELSWQEERTAERIEAFLDRLQISHRRVAQTGILADLPGEAGFPRVAIRADTDALPIFEETGLPFASQNSGVMHACGHDGHTTIALGAAALLKRQGARGPVRLIFQPAEETGGGSLAMIEAGALEGVDFIFGGHLDRHYPAGNIAVTEGAVNASSDRFTIRISGQGGHAARPHESIDAVVVGSLLVMSLQTIVSREVNPAHPSVVTVGRFDAGTAANVIAGHATLEGSIRAQDLEVRAHLHRSLQRIAASVAQLHGAKIDVEIDEGTPPLINKADMVALARRAAEAAVGADQVCQLITANMGGEDFSYYLDHVAGCYVRFGAQVPGRESFPAHSSRFDFDEQALAVGAQYFAHLARLATEHALPSELQQ